MSNDIRYGRKRKGIKKELDKKIEDWLDSIDDDECRSLLKKNVILTGGAIASMLLGEKVNDFDLYFKTKKATKAAADYYVNKFNESAKLEVVDGVSSCEPEVKEESIRNIKGQNEDRVVIRIASSGVAAEDQETYRYFEGESDDVTESFADSLEVESESGAKYRPVFLSQNAITLSHKVQLVIRFYGNPEEIHGNYDFIHAMCWYDYSSGHLELPGEALESLLSRTLVYRGSLYPIASIFRMKKFLERGWRINAGQQLKIMWQISEIDMSCFDTLREQLTGVDAAYLYQLIEALQEVNSDEINSTYVAAIIDRIFE